MVALPSSGSQAGPPGSPGRQQQDPFTSTAEAYDPFRGPAALSPLPVNNNSYGLGTQSGGLAGLSKSPPPPGVLQSAIVKQAETADGQHKIDLEVSATTAGEKGRGREG